MTETATVNAAVIPQPVSTIDVAQKWAGFGLGLWDSIRQREAADDLRRNQERDFEGNGRNATNQAAGINPSTMVGAITPLTWVAIAGGVVVGGLALRQLLK